MNTPDPVKTDDLEFVVRSYGRKDGIVKTVLRPMDGEPIIPVRGDTVLFEVVRVIREVEE